MESGDFRLAATQLELNPYIEIQNIVDFARRRELCLIAYSPLARGRVSFDITLEHLGQRYGKSGSQVILRWLIQKGCVVIPKTTNIEHLRQNINIFDFSLDELEMAFIDNMVRQQKRAMAFGLES
jgi:diketogulonate reductase-like aldo/keto reductase